MIAFVRRFNHPVEEVWDAVTNPERRAAWFGPSAIEGREGGRVAMIGEGPIDPRRIEGLVLVWNPCRLFEHESEQPGSGRYVVRYELTPEGAATVLRMTQTGLSTQRALEVISARHAYLDRLEAHLDGVELPDWKERHDEVRTLYRPNVVASR